MTIEGKFVRAAYNNEGYVILGYQASNRSIGEEWMLLEVGMTVRDNAPDFRLTREASRSRRLMARRFPCRRSASTGGEPPGDSAARERPARFDRLLSVAREPAVRHPLLPRVGISRAAVRRRGFSSDRACLGRLRFQIPGGIAYGQHWLNIKFEKASCACRSGS